MKGLNPVILVLTRVGNFLWSITGRFSFSIILFCYAWYSQNWIVLLAVPFTFFIISGSYNVGLNLNSLKSIKRLYHLIKSDEYRLAKIKLPPDLFNLIKADLQIRKRSLKLGGYDLNENNITLLVITDPKKKGKAPEAFPNHINESYILIPSLDLVTTEVPIRKFIFLHELEHCTSYSVKLESEKISLSLFFLILMFFLMSLTYSINTLIPTIFLILTFRVIAKLRREIPEMSEAQTDIRAFSRMGLDDAKNLVESLKLEYEAQDENAYSNEKYNRTWSYRAAIMETYQYLLDQNDRWTSNQISAALKKLGTRNLSGPLFSIIYSYLLYHIIIHLIDIPVISFILLASLTLVTNIVGASLGVMRDKRAKEVSELVKDISSAESIE